MKTIFDMIYGAMDMPFFFNVGGPPMVRRLRPPTDPNRATIRLPLSRQQRRQYQRLGRKDCGMMQIPQKALYEDLYR